MDTPPDTYRARGGLSWRTRLALVLFAAVAVPAVVVGVHDLLLSAELTYRIVGAAVLAIGALLLAACVGFVGRRPWAYAYAVGSGLGAAAFAAMFFVAQWVTHAEGLRLLFWAVVAALCAGAALAVAREGRVTVAGLARRRVQVASSLLSVGALLSIAQFWNASVRVPPTSAPSLSITTELEQRPVRSDLVPVAATVTIRNTAEAKIWVLGSTYNAWAGTAPALERDNDELVGYIEEQARDGLLAYGAPRHTDDRPEHVVESGELLSELIYLVPGELYTYRLVLHVPPQKYDLLRLEVYVHVAKDTLVLDETYLPPPTVNADDKRTSRLVKLRRVRDTSWMARLLRGEREVQIETTVDRATAAAYMMVTVGRRGETDNPADPEAVRVARLYGIAVADSWAELALK